MDDNETLGVGLLFGKAFCSTTSIQFDRLGSNAPLRRMDGPRVSFFALFELKTIDMKVNLHPDTGLDPVALKLSRPELILFDGFASPMLASSHMPFPNPFGDACLKCRIRHGIVQAHYNSFALFSI